MRCIVVAGQSNRGKSSAIRFAIIELLKKHDFQVSYNSKQYVGDSKELVRNLRKHFYTNKHYVGQITCIGTISGKKVCITTYGDSFKYDIKPALEKAQKAQTDLFVCAAHKKGLEEISKIFGEQISKVEKDTTEDEGQRDGQNEEFGKKLANLVVDTFN